MTAEEPEEVLHPCGCVVTTFPDGSVTAEMCTPCALSCAGDMLKQVARNMARKQLLEEESP